MFQRHRKKPTSPPFIPTTTEGRGWEPAAPFYSWGKVKCLSKVVQSEGLR